MKTDAVTINRQGEGFDRALAVTEKAAVYRGLNPKQALRLRLLAEEMTGMFRTIVGASNALYWIESEGARYSLHLSTRVRVDPDLRDELLKTATSGKNAAAKGFMGRIKDIILQMSEADSAGLPPVMDYGFSGTDTCSFEAPMGVSVHGAVYNWSMRGYRAGLEQHREEEAEKWDELEKSITAKLADEIKIFIRSGAVEMVIEKDFGTGGTL